MRYLFLLPLFFVFGSCTQKLTNQSQSLIHTYQAPKMGTIFKLSFYAKVRKEQADELAAKAFELVDTLNQAFSDYHPESELSQLNLTAGSGKFVKVSDPLWEVLNLSVEASKQTNGDFDITMGAYVKLWRRARRQGKLPSKKLMEQTRTATGYQHILFDEENQAVMLGAKGMKLDLGGIAKGYTADKLLNFFKENGIKSAMIDAGGDLRIGAAPPKKKGWEVEMEHGDAEKQKVWIKNKAIATSGDLYNYIEIDGVKYSHIVDPTTGLGLTRRITVTVIAKNGTTSDYLASAISVMGIEKGKDFLGKTKGIDVMITKKKEEKIAVFSSKFFQKRQPWLLKLR
ncbi:FAD:protein FMN transferase [Flammeovirgaceae bacterium SG7u.111]|nr:FAD:protein FMN transferase [Flammeovirgaceae bacterium SG7u.132]WPO35824.1 FAD:protein FMN transferase [Flammeovirgaceae bacterium SG7u.111]